MDLFLNAINYCKNGLNKAIKNNDDTNIIMKWKLELEKWNQEFQKYYHTCKNPMIIIK